MLYESYYEIRVDDNLFLIEHNWEKVLDKYDETVLYNEGCLVTLHLVSSCLLKSEKGGDS
jgi:hypothetical protein